MRRLVFVFTAIALLLWTMPAGACGDKLLVLGRGARFHVETSEHPARILFYLNPNVEKAEFTKFEGIMNEAGHAFLTVQSRAEFATYLKVGWPDIVLADFDDASGLEQMIKTSPSPPSLLPWVYQETKADAKRAKVKFAAAKNSYRYALLAPLKPHALLGNIEQTMILKAKVAKAQGKARSKVAAANIPVQ